MKTTPDDAYDEVGAVLTALRPRTVVLDPDWSASTLETILAGPTTTSRSPRRRRIVAAGLTAGIVATGGVAYATGVTPDFVNHVISDMTGADAADAHLAQIADLTLPDGSRFAAWRGLTDDGVECFASAENWDGKERTSANGAACGKVDPKDPAGDDVRIEWPAGKEADAPVDGKVTRYQIVYGAVDDPEVVSVHAKGEGIDITMKVDPSSHGFATVLPGISHLPSEDSPRALEVELEYLNPAGDVVRTVKTLG